MPESPPEGSPPPVPPEDETPEALRSRTGSPEAEQPEAASPEAEQPEAGSPEAEQPEAGSPGPADPTSVVHPRVWQRRVAVLREQGHRRLRWVVAGVAVLVVVCVALLVLHTPLLALRHATVRGAQHTGTQAVLQAAGLLDDPPLIDVDPKSTAAEVERLPWVAHAVVVRHWPDSVTIIVTERVPVGLVARPSGGVAVIDVSGRVLAWEASAPPGLVLVVPVTPGLPGTVLARPARPALEVASAMAPSLAARVVSVTANAEGTVSLGLGGGVSAVLGTTAGLEAKLTALASVLAGAHVSGPAVIDVTVPDEPTVGPPPPGPRR
ncbi:MAG TPA: FtsQ-type POTRA domain-containing protein [Acidimicrobiales bacterium]